MNKKLVVLEPAGSNVETRGRWSYTTMRPLEAWRLGPGFLPESRAIYRPESGKRREQPRERGDAQVRLLCYPMPAAPLS